MVMGLTDGPDAGAFQEGAADGALSVSGAVVDVVSDFGRAADDTAAAPAEEAPAGEPEPAVAVAAVEPVADALPEVGYLVTYHDDAGDVVGVVFDVGAEPAYFGLEHGRPPEAGRLNLRIPSLGADRIGVAEGSANGQWERR